MGSDPQNPISGAETGITGTSVTIAHAAPEPMTLTVRVIPSWEDEHSATQRLDELAGTATLAVAPTGGAQAAAAQATPACVSPSLGSRAWNNAKTGLKHTPHARHAKALYRALLTFRQQGVSSLSLPAWPARHGARPMGTITAQQVEDIRGPWPGFDPVIEALEGIETCLAGPEQPVDPPAADPAVTISSGSAVTEGAAAGFTLTADPAPASDLSVTVEIAQTGAMADASVLGARTVTIPAGQTAAAFSVSTVDDQVDEPAGAIAATVADGTGYTAGETASATVTVEDDDATGVALSAPDKAPEGVTYTHLASTDPASPPTVTFTGPSAAAAMLGLATTADRLDEGEPETVTGGLGTLVPTGLGGGVEGSGTTRFAILEPPPEIAVAANTDAIVEGAEAAFTLTASRATGADLTLHLAVSESAGSDFVAAEKERAATVVLPKGETEAAFSVSTVNDAADEPDGTVTVALAGERRGRAALHGGGLAGRCGLNRGRRQRCGGHRPDPLHRRRNAQRAGRADVVHGAALDGLGPAGVGELRHA